MNEEAKERLEFDKEESKKRVRQRCLELSIPNNGFFGTSSVPENSADYSAEGILERAKKFADFVNGEA